MWGFAWIGCAEAPLEDVPTRIVDRAETSPAPPAPAEVHYVDVESATWEWSTAPGLEIVHARLLGDQTGDGLMDAAVEVRRADDPDRGLLLLVPGPLARPLALPADAQAAIVRRPGWFPAQWTDATGDGVLDVLVPGLPDDAGVPGPRRILEGPFVGDLDPSTIATRFDLGGAGAIVDLDLDGTGDRLGGDQDWLAITFGPAERWASGDGPDLVLQRSVCPGTYHLGLDLQAVPDVTGDGVPEWLFFTDGVCRMVPLPQDDDALADLFSPSREADGLRLRVVPDQSGDGRPDVELPDHRHDQQIVFEAPVQLVDGALVGTRRWSAEGWAIPLDFTGDGIADRLVTDRSSGSRWRVAVLEGGPAGERLPRGFDFGRWTLERRDEHAPFARGLEQVFVEQGEALVLVKDLDRAGFPRGVAPLGPATAVPVGRAPGAR